MKSLKTVSQLLDKQYISKEEAQALETVSNQYAISITPHIQTLIDQELKDGGTKHLTQHPIAKQFLPDVQELNQQPQELYDPIGDFAYTPVKGVVHRYPDRCLLKPINVCPVYCRFCFRREFIGPNTDALSKQELKLALEYIASQKNLWEVILTGGDPLMLNPNYLKEIIQALDNIPHVEIIRIHSRVPVVDPQRINSTLLDALSSQKTLYVVLHANHASEFSEAAIQACQSIIAAGHPMLSQSVLLKGINDSVEALAELMKTFVKHKIKPYYLHHPDRVRGTSHFRITIEEGKALMQALREQYSGLCQPIYIQENPEDGTKTVLCS